MHIRIRIFAVLVAGFVLLGSAFAQETVFNVPSGDILDRGKIYGELDFGYQYSDSNASYTPRIVVGLGRQVEAGLNINGIGTPGPSQTILSPAIKWKVYDGGKNGWAFLVGDTMYLPVQNRTYTTGNYVYAEFAKTWRTGTRATFGAYHFSRDVVASAQRAGGQFALEQPINSRLTVATDWYTGNQALGYVTPGAIVKLTPKLTWYACYEIGNHRASSGNRLFLTELGWNFN